MKNRKREIRTSGSVRDEDGQHPHLLGHRRQFLHVAAGATALPATSRIAWAQTYPTRTVRIIVGFPAGGSADIIARLIGQRLTVRLGQQFVIENRPGAGSNIATEFVVTASPDGYTLLIVGGPNAINANLYEKVNFNFIRDIVPVASLNREPYVMVVHPSVLAKTVPEFIAYAKANPSAISMASGGNGTPSHVAGELFKMLTGTNLVHIPYRGGGPALIDLVGGQVQVSFTPMAAALEYIRTGKLRALAVTTMMRSKLLQDLPIVSEFVPGYEASSWYGIGAPRNTPEEVIDKLNKESNTILADPKIKARFADLGTEVLGGSRADFAKLIAEETEKWGNVIRAAHIKAE
jgi:tripartite-type tricarboxylate transporter receptor subunit TctC